MTIENISESYFAAGFSIGNHLGKIRAFVIVTARNIQLEKAKCDSGGNIHNPCTRDSDARATLQNARLVSLRASQVNCKL